MFRVQYFCPRQSPYWQEATARGPLPTFQAALRQAHIVRPPAGRVRILNAITGLVLKEW